MLFVNDVGMGRVEDWTSNRLHLRKNPDYQAIDTTLVGMVVLVFFLEIDIVIILDMPKAGPEVWNMDEEEMGDMMDRNEHDKNYSNDNCVEVKKRCYNNVS